MTPRAPKAVLALAVPLLVVCSGRAPQHSGTPEAETFRSPTTSGVTVPQLSNMSALQVTTLRKQCKERGLTGPEVQKADSLTAVSRTYKQEGNRGKAELATELAAAYYRLALSNAALTQSQKRISELKKSLSTAKGQLRTYKEVLYEIESIK